MLDFKKLELDDIIKIKPFFDANPSGICDRTIGSIVLWRNYFNTFYCIFNDALYFRINFSNKATAFTFPLEINKSGVDRIAAISLYCKANNLPLSFCSLTEEQANFIKNNYKAEIFTNDVWSDYVYEADKLISLEGKKYHGQRNFVNRFIKLYTDKRTEALSKDNIEDVKAFLHSYYEKTQKDSLMFNEEKISIFEMLDNFDKVYQQGLVLYVKNVVVAVAIGERVGDTLFVHFEKANTEYSGSYQTIVNEFAKTYAVNGVKYINREDDAGDEGLRKSKLSYHPIFMAKKYSAKIATAL